MVVSGEVEASSESQAAKLIRDKGYVVFSIKLQGFGIASLVRKFTSRISFSDMTAFTRQLATMVNAGLPITEALLVLRSQNKTSMQKIVAQILADVEGGEALSKACEKHTGVFSTTYIALLRSGEVGGVLDRVLLKLADNMEKEQEFRGKVKSALIYPIIIIVGMVLVALIMMIFVIPKLLDLYKDFNAKLPLPTQILIGISSFFFKFWPFVIVAAFVAGYVYLDYRKTPSGRRKTDAFLLKFPLIGDLQRQIILTDMTRTLSLMTGAGVSILEGLGISAEVVSNTIIGDALKDVQKNVEKGFPIAYSFARHSEAFPYILSQMIAVGEETGKMDEVLEKVSHVFEVESEQRVKSLTAAVEPIVMILLGVGVAFLVIAIILPIYNLTSSF